MAFLDLASHPHRRFNPLTGDWVLVSPHRTGRPWQGQVETVASEAQPAFDPRCYLCPGNTRNGGVRNPQYNRTFVFDNDFAALRLDTPASQLSDGGLLVAESEPGRCRVVCFSPHHDLTMARMNVPDLRIVVDTWTEEFVELEGQPGINAVQIFENRGTIMGCSNAHPHGQIWANRTLPNELAKEVQGFRSYYHAHSSSLLSDYLALELQKKERLISANDHFVALIPFWAVWPFETMVVSRRPVADLPGLSDEERTALADMLHQITVRYDNLFKTSFPYTMGFHQRPTDGLPYPGFHFHAHFYPPLLRSATVKKFMVGYEMLGMPQRDITPESAAARLREAPSVHYLEAK